MQLGKRRGGSPSSVIPLSPSRRATLPVTRSTGADVDPEVPKPAERGSVLDGDQPPQVLTDEVVERNAVRSLIPLAAGKRRAIALREERKAEADDQERGRDNCVAGVTRERERREPHAERAAARQPLRQPQRRSERTSDEHRGRKRHERRKEEDEISLVVAPPQLEEDEQDCAERSRVDERKANRSEAGRAGGHSRNEDTRRCGRDEQREPEPLERESAAGQDVPDRRTGPVRDEHPSERAHRDPHDRARKGESGRFGNRQQRELPAAGAVPGKPATGSGEVGAERHRRKEREREQQRGRLPADDAQPPSCCPAGGLSVAQLLDRRDQIEARRHSLELGARARDAGSQVVHLPQPGLSCLERNHPGIAAKDHVESTGSRQGLHALGEKERRRRRPVIAGGVGEGRTDLRGFERVVGRGEEVAEEESALQRPGANLDKVQPCGLRHPSFGATEAKNLAPLGAALCRQPSGAQNDLCPQPLDTAEAGKASSDRALAEEDERARITGDRVRQRGSRPALEDGLRLGALGGNAEPDGPHRPRSVRNPLDRLGDGAILGDKGAGPAADDDRGAGCDAEDDEDDGPTPAAQPSANQPERVEH